jgi:hypothetical protein
MSSIRAWVGGEQPEEHKQLTTEPHATSNRHADTISMYKRRKVIASIQTDVLMVIRKSRYMHKLVPRGHGP